MADHSSCPNCHNSDGGTNIYKCRKCSKVYCSRCATGIVFSNCPRCGEHEGRNIGQIQNEASLPVASSYENDRINREQNENAERRQREVLEAMEAESEAKERHQEELIAAMEAQREAQRADIADAWQLQAESKAEKAHDLYEAGMYEEARRLAVEAIGENGQGDPTNISGQMAAAWALSKLGHHAEAKKYYLNQISLLRTSRWREQPSVFLRVLRELPREDDLLSLFSNAIEDALRQWSSAGEMSDIAYDLQASAAALLQLLFDRGLVNVASLLINVVNDKADSLSYCRVVDTLIRNNRFDEAAVLTDALMRRLQSVWSYALELHAYWLEISAHTGKAVEDRFTPFLNGIPHSDRERFIERFNSLASNDGKFSPGTLIWLKDRIAERDEHWLAERSRATSQTNPQPIPLTPPIRSTRIWPWIVGIGAFVCFLGVAVVVGIFAMGRADNSNRNDSPSNSSRAVNASSNPSNVSSRDLNRAASANTNSGANVANANTNPSVSSNPPATTRASDDFSAQRWSTGSSQYGKMWYQDGEYHMFATKSGYIAIYGPDTKDYSTENATVLVELRSVNGTSPNAGYGLIFHGEKKQGLLEDYAFLIYNESGPKYKIISHKAGQEITLVDWTPSSAIKVGTSPNQIEVKIHDLKLDFYINGRLITSLTDVEGYRRGRVGFYSSDNVEVAFDNLEISKSDG